MRLFLAFTAGFSVACLAVAGAIQYIARKIGL